MSSTRLLVVALCAASVLSFESQVQADVLARQFGKLLIVTGTSQDDQIVVDLDSYFGTVAVIDSDEVFFADEIARIVIYGYGGNDQIDVCRHEAVIPNLVHVGLTSTSTVDLDIVTAQGDDHIGICGDWNQVRILAGDGENSIDLFGTLVEPPSQSDLAVANHLVVQSRFRGLYIVTGAHDDTISISDVSVGEALEGEGPRPFEWSWVYIGAGNDTISVFRYGSDESDTPWLSTWIATGFGDDDVDFVGKLNPQDLLDGGGGQNDFLSIDTSGEYRTTLFETHE